MKHKKNIHLCRHNAFFCQFTCTFDFFVVPLRAKLPYCARMRAGNAPVYVR